MCFFKRNEKPVMSWYKIDSEMRYKDAELREILGIRDEYEILEVVKYHSGWKVMVKKNETEIQA